MTNLTKNLTNKIAIITGASSGIGEATAFALAEAGCHLALGARRSEKLEKVAEKIRQTFKVRVFTNALDVTQTPQIDAFVAATQKEFGRMDILVNNAGLAKGTDLLIDGKEQDWETMLETNVLGVMKITRAVLKPMLSQSEGGHIINLGSMAGLIYYSGGSAYCASKHALRAVTGVLRHELLGKPIRITSIDPGLVETEFSVVRFSGDADKAKNVYQGMTPLVAEDIAQCIVFAASRPKHVNVDQLVVTPLDQAQGTVARK